MSCPYPLVTEGNQEGAAQLVNIIDSHPMVWVPSPFAARKPNIRYYVIPHADHLLSFPKKQTMDWNESALEEQKPESTEYFFVMASWLTRQLGLKP